MSTVDILSHRSFGPIERELRTSLHFLNEYELLMPQGRPLLDSSYELIRIKKACVETALINADNIANAFKEVFNDCPVYPQLEAISVWTFKLRFSIKPFHSIPDLRLIIDTLLGGILSGDIIPSPEEMGFKL